jgi:hypothetical protein
MHPKRRHFLRLDKRTNPPPKILQNPKPRTVFGTAYDTPPPIFFFSFTIPFPHRFFLFAASKEAKTKKKKERKKEKRKNKRNTTSFLQKFFVTLSVLTF